MQSRRHRSLPRAIEIGMHHFADDRPGPDDRDFDHEVVELLGFMRGSVAICARLSTWNMPMVSAFCSAL